MWPHRSRASSPSRSGCWSGPGALFVFISTSPFVYQQVYGLTEVQFALAFAANAVFFGHLQSGQSPAPCCGGRRRRLAAVLVLFCLACVALLVSVLVFDSLWAVVVPFSSAPLAFGATNPNAYAIALHRHGQRAGAASALAGAGRFGVAGMVVRPSFCSATSRPSRLRSAC